MPIYEYQCDECQERFEKLIRLSNAQQEVKCPKCGSGRVRKALSIFGVAGGSKAGGASSSNGSSCGST